MRANHARFWGPKGTKGSAHARQYLCWGDSRMVGIGSHDKALPQQRGKAKAIEMDAAANADGLAKDIDPTQELNRPRLLVVIEKERLMYQSADQVVASAILYEPRLPHVEQCITKPITMSILLCQ